MKKNTTNTNPTSEWVSTASMPDEFVYTNAEQVLSQPAFIVSSTSESCTSHLYTKEQMYEMFRLGYMAKWRGPYRVLGKMAVGETTYLPYEAWDSARSAATRLKKNHGKEFQVKKLGKFGSEGRIEIVRKS